MSQPTASPDVATEASSRQPQLLRVLSAKTGTALIIGGIIGSGIFMVPSSVASQVGSPSLSLLVWIGGAVLSLAGALCFAELGAAIPESGGIYAFLRRAYGSDIVAYLFGWHFYSSSSRARWAPWLPPLHGMPVDCLKLMIYGRNDSSRWVASFF